MSFVAHAVSIVDTTADAAAVDIELDDEREQAMERSRARHVAVRHAVPEPDAAIARRRTVALKYRCEPGEQIHSFA